MIKIKINNLEKPGVLEKILFTKSKVKKGQNLALISNDDGEFIIKSPYDGFIKKSLPVGTVVDNGILIFEMEQELESNSKPKAILVSDELESELDIEDGDIMDDAAWNSDINNNSVNNPHQKIKEISDEEILTDIPYGAYGKINEPKVVEANLVDEINTNGLNAFTMQTPSNADNEIISSDPVISKMMRLIIVQAMMNNNSLSEESKLKIQNLLDSYFNNNNGSINYSNLAVIFKNLCGLDLNLDSMLEGITKNSKANTKTESDKLFLKKIDNNGNVMQVRDVNVLMNAKEFADRIEGKEVRKKIKPNRSMFVKSLINAQRLVPQLTIGMDVDMSEVLRMQLRLKSLKNNMTTKFTTVSFVIKALSLCLNEYPRLNSLFDPETNELVIKKSHHIGVVTETSEGEIVPVIKFVEKLSLHQIAVNLQEKTSLLKSGKIKEIDLIGNTISVANYGALGAVSAQPTLLYPNAALISLGRLVRKPIVTRLDKMAIRTMMRVSITIDQRIIEASEAGIFLTRLKEILEKPDLLSIS